MRKKEKNNENTKRRKERRIGEDKKLGKKHFVHGLIKRLEPIIRVKRTIVRAMNVLPVMSIPMLLLDNNMKKLVIFLESIIMQISIKLNWLIENWQKGIIRISIKMSTQQKNFKKLIQLMHF